MTSLPPVQLSQSQVPRNHYEQHLNPAFIASQPKIRDVKLSPNGNFILYQVTQFYRSTPRPISALWLAETNKPSSAVPVTQGEFNDRSGVFHPDGTRILFLSDRQTPGKRSVLCQLSLVDYISSVHRDQNDGDIVNIANTNAINNESPSSSNNLIIDEVLTSPVPKPTTIPEPTILTSKFTLETNIQEFQVSPSGNLIGFIIDEENVIHYRTEIRKNDVDVIEFGPSRGKSRSSKLGVYDFTTNEIRTFETRRNRNQRLEGFTWSSDSKEILYRMRWNREMESDQDQVLLESISVVEEEAEPKYLGSYPRSPSGSHVWLSTGHIASLQSYEPRNILDARTLHIHPPPPVTTTVTERIYGIDEDAIRILPASVHPKGEDDTKNNYDFLAVEVGHDTESRIDIIVFSPTSPTHSSRFTLFRTSSNAIWFNSWDVKRIIHSSSSNPTTPVTYFFAAVLSSGPRHEPPNIWSGKIQIDLHNNNNGHDDKEEEEEENHKFKSLSRSNQNLIRLSNHLTWLTKTPPLKTDIIHWKNKDDIQLSGLIRFPPNYHITNGRIPTILFIHGGPYRRDIPDYMPYFCNWRELLASFGYLVISPNYRASQGRGSSFASSGSAGIGIYDWSDCDSMVDEVIRRGWADEQKLGIAGWSHGGSLTAWGVTKTKTKYKAAVIGAGVTNWEGMVLESTSPELEAAIGGISPWPSEPSNTNFTLTSERRSSPIHNISGTATAVLILHGERDQRVPVGQAHGFYRGLKRCAATRGRESAQLVVYPREPHGFVERKHAQDVMERVLIHFNTYLESKVERG